MEPNYFTLKEFLVSSTARKKNIDNFPESWQIVENLRELAGFLDCMREAWGSGIRVSSGYRCPELNKAVGGVPTSVHMRGWAADVMPSNGKMDEFLEFAAKFLADKDFDQALTEHKGKVTWLHIGIRANDGSQRRQIKELVVK